MAHNNMTRLGQVFLSGFIREVQAGGARFCGDWLNLVKAIVRARAAKKVGNVNGRYAIPGNVIEISAVR
jgi:hypothetical protein